MLVRALSLAAHIPRFLPFLTLYVQTKLYLKTQLKEPAGLFVCFDFSNPFEFPSMLLCKVVLQSNKKGGNEQRKNGKRQSYFVILNNSAK